MQKSVIKVTGEHEAYDASKLCQSLIASGAPSDTAYAICHAVEKKLDPTVTTTQIWRETLKHLMKEKTELAARYNMRRAMANLGPDGFAFEKFIAVILQSSGFTTQLNQHITGASGIDHEIDILAEKDGCLYFIEAKYKNEYGLKTHINDVMYSYARFLDLTEKRSTHTDYRIWMITNTEFTETAQKFAEYKSTEMNLIGWGYPRHQSLEMMITEKKLYPVSIIPSLTLKERKALIGEGWLVIEDLLPYTPEDLVRTCGIKIDRARHIMTEAHQLVDV